MQYYAYSKNVLFHNHPKPKSLNFYLRTVYMKIDYKNGLKKKRDVRELNKQEYKWWTYKLRSLIDAALKKSSRWLSKQLRKESLHDHSGRKILPSLCWMVNNVLYDFFFFSIFFASHLSTNWVKFVTDLGSNNALKFSHFNMNSSVYTSTFL